MKTKIHYYSYDMHDAAQAAQYDALAARLRAETKAGTRGREMHAIGTPHSRNEVEEVELDGEKNFFINQWNTPTARVFDWYEAVHYIHGRRSTRCRSGHWLEITPEMAELRRKTLVCGYTGKHFTEGTFNLSALGDKYLKETELHLLRLAPMVDADKERAPLTEEEKALLLPLYREAQIHGEASRCAAYFAQKREEIETEHAEAVAAEGRKYRGFRWLVDHEINLENCIYYPHTRKFCFGWRQGLSPEGKAALVAALEGFPFPEALEFETAK